MILKKPLVSVLMITYGHEKYIKQAIEGVLIQKCNFKIELIVANDCSPDNTCEVIKEIIRGHPRSSWINYTRHEQNKGVQPNFIWAASQANGKYIAICEGDDYWTDPLKLQKQVDFLEANPDYKFSMGRVDTLIDKTGIIIKREEHINPNKKETYTLRDYLKNPFSQTSSFVFKNSNEPLPEWFNNVHAGDQSLVVIKTGVCGKIKYHKDLFSIYRLNNGSVSNTVSYSVYEKFLSSLIEWEFYLGNSNYKIIFKINRYKYKLYHHRSKFTNRFILKLFEFEIKLIDSLLKIL